ncbi:MAG: biotin--[acetyl-CoA-carboxylase] ligase [Thermoanaerobaculia bacterium]|nr:biotin--[acetyl-CoA-carboxylase] ligase [Thermoanaerobaculia bacterium]
MSPTTGFESLQRELTLARPRVDLALIREIDSTQRLAVDVARDLARDEIEVVPTAFVAWRQTAGRGRQGRLWSSRGGLGVYATLLYQLPPTALELLPLVVPLALLEVLDRYLPVQCCLDWPNDLVADLAGEWRKIGGVLMASFASVQGRRSVAIGFGINVGHEVVDLPTARAASLHLCATSANGAGSKAELPSLGILAAELIGAVCRRIEEPGSPSEVVKEYADRSIHRLGDQLQCRVGATDLEGTFLGFTTAGHLRLEVEGVEQTLRSGEIIE